jgi:hypothetical protein
VQLGGLLLAIVYLTWSGFHPEGSESAPYHSPVHAHIFGIEPGWGVLGPALVSLTVPILFRATCYYMRRAYYRSAFGDPPACAVGELRGRYGGETRFPFILQNLHRYALYLALVYIVFHWINTVHSFVFDGRFGVGLGSLLVLADVALLTLYAFSCHAMRHVVGGNVDCFSCAKGGMVRHSLWSRVTALNGHHMAYFWWSLYSVLAADLYIRLLHAGVFADPRVVF